jgi:hypothetical protein
MEIYFDIDREDNTYAAGLVDINTEYNDIIHIYYNIDDIARINIKNVIIFLERQQRLLIVSY